MKTLISVILMVCFSFSVYAMRCGNSLINEGDSLTRLFSLCGEPTTNRGQVVVYVNKDQDGMTYTIHSDALGIIDDISYTRGE